ncbi:hypothetical protein GGQ74_003119 [Desulfobaculum xiamenense]|uniref:Uncharacterized protein n=1 Tax=Desulfobaculum xiamenense TaxID=995050 RepID=A0A846QQG5_9BACT|nr:hypothetical protein [Desulfobaculum xiamenense]NJB69417.1 hypothetical protein [Desulfobaculum xiamenense]
MSLPQFNPVLIGLLLLLALHMTAALTGLGAFSIAVFSEYAAGARKKVLYKKFAQQISQLGVMFLFYLLVAVCGSLAVFHFQFPEYLKPWLANPMLALPAMAALGCTVLFGCIYAFSWKGSRNAPALHIFWGALAALCGMLMLAASLSVKIMVLIQSPEQAAEANVWQLIPRGVSSLFFAPLFVQTILLSLSCASALGLVWLLMRRNRDDWGRDYYTFAARCCAKWALLGTVATTLAQGWMYWIVQPLAANTPREALLPFLSGGGAVCALTACALWTIVIRSQTPMRNKFSMLCGVVLLIMALAGFSAVNAMIFFPA